MNQDIFRHYKILVDFLGEVLGQDYEIDLFDLKNGNNRLIAATNNRISGYNIGDSLPNDMMKIINEQQETLPASFIGEPWNKNSISVLRSSGLFIKDADNKIIGLLVIIFDDSRFIALHDQLLSLAHPLSFLQNHSYHTIHNMEYFDSKKTKTEKPAATDTNISNLMDNIYRDAFIDTNLPQTRLTQNERITIIRRLEELGFFKLKGAVQYAAKHLECSSASIYRYLEEIKNK